MAIWKVTAKRKFDDGSVSISPGMSVEVSTTTSSSSFWTQSQYRKAIAECFVSQYGLKCAPSKFEQQVNNVSKFEDLGDDIKVVLVTSLSK